MNEKDRQQAAEELLDYARTVCMVTPNMVARATGLQVPARLIWCAADAGKLPQAYYDGYQLENLRAEYQLA